MPPPDPSLRPTTARKLAPIAAGAWGFGVCGLAIALLTLRLNPHLHHAARDEIVLCALFAAGYATLGALLGLIAAGGLSLIARVRPSWASRLGPLACDLLAVSPLLYVALLPDVGLTRTLLTRLIFSDELAPRLAVALAIPATAVLIGAALRRSSRAWERRRGEASRGRLRAAAAITVPALLLLLAVAPPAAQRSVANPAAAIVPPPADADGAPPPVLLLVVDGADPDVIEPMIERGQLPTLARFRAEGVWGPLATFYPSLSPVIWTTLATGRSPDDHGVHGFLVFRLPGLSRPIQQFPVHTGLNFRLFPLLEQIPGIPSLRAPYTSSMRRVPALWSIVGQRRTVGVYRWRVSWPAEPVNGFVLAESVGLLDPGSPAMADGDPSSGRGAAHPPGLEQQLPYPQSAADVAPYVTSLDGLDPDDPRLRLVEGSQGRSNLDQLVSLLDRFRPGLTLASFYPVDAFHHRFHRERREGGTFAPAIEQQYRLTDARLGELLARLGREHDVVVVSDHGYDEALDSHTHAPDGVFFALGPSFRRGARVELSVYDVAPLVLELSGYPVAADMPAAAQRRYLAALRPEHPAHLRQPVATYGLTDELDWTPRDSPRDDETLEQLRELGYVDG